MRSKKLQWVWGELGGHMRIWEDNIKMYLRDEIVRVWTGFKWVRVRISGGLF
jgi:hypothetical protein